MAAILPASSFTHIFIMLFPTRLSLQFHDKKPNGLQHEILEVRVNFYDAYTHMKNVLHYLFTFIFGLFYDCQQKTVLFFAKINKFETIKN